MSNGNLLTIKEASKELNVSIKTLRIWDNNGSLKAVKTIGGHRRYKQEDVDKLKGITHEPLKKTGEIIVAQYSRVSSHEQKSKGDLDIQSQRLSEFCAKRKYRVESIIKDVGSGLSDTRVGFNKLCDLIIEKKINKVIIENKDRLTRFQYNLIMKFFDSYNVEIECVDNIDVSEEEELVNDIMMLMASFSGKLYGRRSAKNRKKKLELLNQI